MTDPPDPAAPRVPSPEGEALILPRDVVIKADSYLSLLWFRPHTLHDTELQIDVPRTITALRRAYEGQQATTLQSLREALTQAQQERDKWLKAFNESEQFQNGPTQRAEAAEAALAQQAQEIARLKEQKLQIAGAVNDYYNTDAPEALTAFRALRVIGDALGKPMESDPLRPHGEEP